MPSPFPGMDPYLENPALWPDVHHRLIDVASEMLLQALRPRYFVQIDERLYVANDADEARSLIVPDLHVREIDPDVDSFAAMSSVAVAPGVEVDSLLNVEVHESRLQIVDRDQNQVVTVIEILSPANKVKGSAGQRSYEEKKQEVIESRTSLVEIDLLRAGPPLYCHERLGAFDYMAQVWRWTGKRHRRWVWPMRLADRLKVIPIPVRPDDKDAALDLQAVLNIAYERAGYELRVDYGKRPVMAISQEAEQWAKQVTEIAKH